MIVTLQRRLDSVTSDHQWLLQQYVAINTQAGELRKKAQAGLSNRAGLYVHSNSSYLPINRTGPRGEPSVKWCEGKVIAKTPAIRSKVHLFSHRHFSEIV